MSERPESVEVSSPWLQEATGMMVCIWTATCCFCLAARAPPKKADLAPIDAICSEWVGQAVIDETQLGLDQGVFGAPTFVIGDEIYWGKDRFVFIEAHLSKGHAMGRLPQ